MLMKRTKKKRKSNVCDVYENGEKNVVFSSSQRKNWKKRKKNNVVLKKIVCACCHDPSRKILNDP
jgi:hypothetical protein